MGRVLVVVSLLLLLLGIVPAARAIADCGDSQHPSGNDRCEEPGGSGDQGNTPADPDEDDNGGVDQSGGSGGANQQDKDGNNGCGNDQDFEDDNNGNCGGTHDDVEPSEPPTEEPTEDATEAPTEDPTDAPTESPTEEPTDGATEPAPGDIDVDFDCDGFVVDSDKGLSNITVIFTDGTSVKTEFSGPEQYHFEYTTPAGLVVDAIMVKAGNPDAGEHASDGERFVSDATCIEPTEGPTDGPTEVPGDEPTEIPTDDVDGSIGGPDDPAPGPDPHIDPPPPTTDVPPTTHGGGGIGDIEDPETTGGPELTDAELPATGAPALPLGGFGLGTIGLGGVLLRRSRRSKQSPAAEGGHHAPVATEPILDSPAAASRSITAPALTVAALGVIALGIALLVRGRSSR
jgi:LPXTG-motif cell wall-anchored protein